MNLLFLVPLYLAAICSLGVGFLVLLRDYRKLENISFFGLGLGVAGWATGIAGFIATRELSLALFWAKFYYIFPLLIVISSVFFSQYFLIARRAPKWLTWLISICGFVLGVLLVVMPTFITSSIVYRSYGKQVLLNPNQYGLYGIYLLFCFCFTILTLIYKRKNLKHLVEVQQITIFLSGFVISAALGVYFNLVLPAFGNYKLIAVGPLMTAFWILSTAYAIAKHRMFDIRSFVVRAAGYAITSTTLSILYIAPLLYLIGTALLGFPFKWVNFIPGVLVATIAAYNFNRLRLWFDDRTARFFFRDAYDSAAVLGDFTRLLVSTIDLKELLHESSSFIASRLKIETVTFVINETSSSAPRIIGLNNKILSSGNIRRIIEYMADRNEDVVETDLLGQEHLSIKRVLHDDNVALLIRLSDKADKNKDMGYMLLDYKKSGNAYTGQDKKTLGSVADVLVIAIQNALHFEEIQNFNFTLQRKVEEATSSMRRTNAKLKALDETKDDFISMASHQLRTPLTSVKGYISMVLEGDAGPLTALQRKMLDQAFVSSQRMVFLIADLLNVSRLKTGKFVLEPTTVNLAKTVADEVNQLKETAKNRSIDLSYTKPVDFPELEVDETKIRQVIMNFIDNAIYYTPSSGKIHVELQDKPATIELRVIDTGIGVPKHEQQHLFTKFYRAGNARKARPDGTGLGLFMAKKVVIAHGGAVIFESHEGKGSIFGFTLAKDKLRAATPTSHPTPVSVAIDA